MLTKRTFLMIQVSKEGEGVYKSCDKYFALLCTRGITEYPDLDGDIDGEDCTTLSDERHKYEAALPDSGGAMAFPTLFDEVDEANLAKLDDTKSYNVAVWFGGTAADGIATPEGGKVKREYTAQVRYRLTGGSVGDVRPAEITIFETNDEATILDAFPIPETTPAGA